MSRVRATTIENDALWLALDTISEGCRAEGRSLTPHDVVFAAAVRESVLHSVFQWDDGPANDYLRLVHARELIEHCRRMTTIRPHPMVRRRKGVDGAH